MLILEVRGVCLQAYSAVDAGEVCGPGRYVVKCFSEDEEEKRK